MLLKIVLKMKQLLEVFDFSIRLNTMVFRIISKINLKKKMHGNVFVRLNSIYLKDLPTDKRATIINTNSTSLLSKYLWNHKLPLNIQKCIRILPVLEYRYVPVEAPLWGITQEIIFRPIGQPANILSFLASLVLIGIVVEFPRKKRKWVTFLSVRKM